MPAPPEMRSVLEDQRAALEDSRTQLGAALLQSSQAQDAEVVRLRTAPVVAAPPPASTKTVIDDGPAAKPKTAKKRVPSLPRRLPRIPSNLRQQEPFPARGV